MKEQIESPEVVFLDPQKIKIFHTDFGTIHVMLENGSLYRGVFAVAAFPVSNPTRYISLFYYDEKEKEREIGMIEDINSLSQQHRELVKQILKRQYFSFEILAINSIKFAYGLLFFDVKTEKGTRQFSMRWEASRAIDYAGKGKIILDIFEDRYILPDLSKLSHKEQELFMKYIYW
ncbi:MAG TPA: DUF1854 domain-containing protein [bacterium]|nr:DUF1854 domain-containing protein [bacterium]